MGGARVVITLMWIQFNGFSPYKPTFCSESGLEATDCCEVTSNIYWTKCHDELTPKIVDHPSESVSLKQWYYMHTLHTYIKSDEKSPTSHIIYYLHTVYLQFHYYHSYYLSIYGLLLLYLKYSSIVLLLLSKAIGFT